MHAWEALNAMSACSQVFDECGDDLCMHAAKRLRHGKGYDELMCLHGVVRVLDACVQLKA